MADSLTTHRRLNAQDITNKVKRIAFEIIDRHPQGPLAFVGIHTRGVTFADRVLAEVNANRSEPVERGTIDISLYRDDLDNIGTIPSIKGSDIPFDPDGAKIILFDDVLYTGRTIRAAIDVLMDYGRPSRIELAVLVDRGHRELPIAADYCGEVLETRAGDYVRVHLSESDESDEVLVHQKIEPGDVT